MGCYRRHCHACCPYLKYSLAAVLTFVGVKMLVAGVYKIPVVMSLGVILTLLAASIVASLLAPATLGRARTQ